MVIQKRSNHFTKIPLALDVKEQRMQSQRARVTSGSGSSTLWCVLCFFFTTLHPVTHNLFVLALLSRCVCFLFFSVFFSLFFSLSLAPPIYSSSESCFVVWKRRYKIFSQWNQKALSFVKWALSREDATSVCWTVPITSCFSERTNHVIADDQIKRAASVVMVVVVAAVIVVIKKNFWKAKQKQKDPLVEFCGKVSIRILMEDLWNVKSVPLVWRCCVYQN